MSFGRFRLAIASVMAVACCVVGDQAFAQNNNAPQVAGVQIDANGVLRIRVVNESPDLLKARQRAAKAELSADVQESTELRKISLNRLEAAVQAELSVSGSLSPEMRYLAGLTRITHVFLYPESNDIVIAGPAEGFYLDASGRPVGIESGRAVMELQDLVAALRAYSPTGNRENVISVSIDPTQEGLQRMSQTLASIPPRFALTQPRAVAQQLKQSLGMQTVSIKGVSLKSHFAQVLVEADYRMKLIGIGLERPPVKITTYYDKATPRSGGSNALNRWYFTPNYDCVTVSEDGTAMQLTGEGVKLVSEHELVSNSGQRSNSGRVDRASKQFVDSFTRNYAKIAAKVPVYAQLRNLIDLSVAAAYIQDQDYYAQTGWDMAFFGSEEKFPLDTYPVPEMVESAVNAKIQGNTLMTPIGGGVNIQPLQAVRRDRVAKDDSGNLTEARQAISVQNLKPGQWWWD